MPKLSLAKLERHLYSAADRLRQEGLDASIYKDYIFGLLFLKRCSDVFREEWDAIVDRKVAWGMIQEEVESQYGENPDYYATFFVPERARWSHLQVNYLRPEHIEKIASTFERYEDVDVLAVANEGGG